MQPRVVEYKGEKLPSVPMHNIVQTPPVAADFLHSLVPQLFVFHTLVAHRDDCERDHRMIPWEIKDSCVFSIIESTEKGCCQSVFKCGKDQCQTCEACVDEPPWESSTVFCCSVFFLVSLLVCARDDDNWSRRDEI